MSKSDVFHGTTPHDWLKDLAPLFHPIRSKPSPFVIRQSQAFSRALCQRHVITSSFDWFTVLSVSLVLARVITFSLVLRHSVEKHSIISVTFRFPIN